MISEYFKSVEDILNAFSNLIKTYTITVKYFSRYKGYIKCEVVFSDDSLLSFSEVKDTEISFKDKYSYHYMLYDNELVFRYDNAKHHPEIRTFPHHKHTQFGINESKEMNLEEILSEIEIRLISNKYLK